MAHALPERKPFMCMQLEAARPETIAGQGPGARATCCSQTITYFMLISGVYRLQACGQADLARDSIEILDRIAG
jgi:hypothetical protein